MSFSKNERKEICYAVIEFYFNCTRVKLNVEANVHRYYKSHPNKKVKKERSMALRF